MIRDGGPQASSSGQVPESGLSRICLRRQFIDAAVGMSADDPGDDVGEIGVRLDAVELGGFDERGDDGPMLRAAVGAGEERILAGQGQRPVRALDGVGQFRRSRLRGRGSSPANARAHSGWPRRASSSGDQAELLAQPWLHGLEDRPVFFPARDRPDSAILRWAAPGAVDVSGIVGAGIGARDGLDRRCAANHLRSVCAVLRPRP